MPTRRVREFPTVDLIRDFCCVGVRIALMAVFC